MDETFIGGIEAGLKGGRARGTVISPGHRGGHPALFVLSFTSKYHQQGHMTTGPRR
jgi:hypothetical protein